VRIEEVEAEVPTAGPGGLVEPVPVDVEPADDPPVGAPEPLEVPVVSEEPLEVSLSDGEEAGWPELGSAEVEPPDPQFELVATVDAGLQVLVLGPPVSTPLVEAGVGAKSSSSEPKKATRSTTIPAGWSSATSATNGTGVPPTPGPSSHTAVPR